MIGADARGEVSSVATLRPRSEIAANETDIGEIASRIDAAGSVVIMRGAGCHGAADELRALSDHLKAPLIHSVKGKDIMPYDDPRWMGGVGMIGTKASYDAITGCELLLMLGTDYPYSDFLPRKHVVVQIDERAEALGRRTPTDFAAVGSVRPSLMRLLSRVAAKDDSSFFDHTARARAKWNCRTCRTSILPSSAGSRRRRSRKLCSPSPVVESRYREPRPA